MIIPGIHNVSSPVRLLFIALTFLSTRTEGFTNNITVPHLSGIFLALDPITSQRSFSGWHTDLSLMKDIGIEFLVIRAAAQGTSWNVTTDPKDGCPLGRFKAYYQPLSGSPLQRCLEQNDRQSKMNNDTTTLHTVLSAAKALGLGVHLGLAYPDGAANSAVRNANATQYYKDYAGLQWSIADDVWHQYSSEFGNGTILGFYTDLEESNEVGYLALASSLAGHLLQPLSHNIHTQLSSELLVWASPYYVGNLTRHKSTEVMNANFYADFWGQLFSWAPDFGLIAPQDSMGAQGNSFYNVSTYVDAMRRASQNAVPTQRPFWSNVELFETWPRTCQWPSACHGRHPAPMSRIKKQLFNEYQRADALIAWEWESCLSPLHSNETKILYEEYKAYVFGT